GESLWRRAAEQDAPMTLARSLFDILPPIRLEEPILPEFDEAEWRAKEARRSAEQPVQTAAPAFAATSEDDFFADSWLSSAGNSSTPASNTRIYDDLSAVTAAGAAASSADDDDDDLLASLLGFGGSEPAAAPATPANDRDQIQPFGFDWDDDTPATPQPRESLPSSLGDIGVHDTELPRGNNADVGGVQPFSFDDWGLDEELGSAKTSTPAASASTDADLDFPDISAFSLDDDPADKSTNVQPFSLEAENTGGVQPFSLDEDLGDFGGVAPFSFEDEARTPSTGNAPAPSESGLGSVQPFSLDDWGLDDAAGGGSLKPLSTDELTSSGDLDDFGAFKPFSLDELSLDTLEDETGGSLSGPQIGSDDQESEEPSGFSWQEPSWRTQNTQSRQPESSEGDSIFAKLMRNRPAEPAEPESPQPAQASAQNNADDDLNFFSIDDEPLRLDEADDQEGWFADQPPSAAELVEPFQGFSTGEPAPTTEQPAEPTAQHVQEVPTEASNFFSLDDLEADQGFSWETSPATQQPDQTAPAEPGGFFSLDDLEAEQGFSWETGAANQPAETPAEQEAQPFSLSDLGLSDDELDALNIPAETSPASDADQEADALPFSLSDLGLSDDELDALSLDTNTTAEASALPTLPEDMRSDLAETSQPVEATEAEPDMTPFSLSDLGLDEDELSFFEQAQAEQAGESETSAPVQPVETPEGEPDMTPFSLSDLGLDEDELSFFEQAQAEQTSGADTSAPVESAETTESEADMTPFSLADLGLNEDELAFLEQSQGGQELDTASQQTSEDVDLLFADFDLPAAEESQPATPTSPFAEQANQPLETPAETNIFGEPLTADVNEQTFDAVPATPGAEAEPDMTPFSLADLGLNDDELSFFEQAQAEQAGETEASAPVQPATPEAEPDMTPFSLSDLGLDEDELSFFEQAQAEQTSGADTPAPVESAETTESEPDMTPFSLADLGLNDDELSFFEQAQAEQSVTEQPETQASVENVGQPVESFESPFSLADLESDSPFASLDQAPESASAAEQPASVFDNAAQTDDEPLPMELPEGAQPVASAAEAEAVQAAPAQPVTSTPAFSAGGGDLSSFHSMLEADPENDAMRLAVARMSQQTNDIGQAVEQYKQLIKRGSLLDEVVVDLQDSIADADDPQMLRRLHRLLGDAYMKQNRFREAMDEYSWTLARSR
ncbi:MAG: hypothetical protein JOZ51_18090, partial [Chloroflexi bacterium]|nr:hypothetical protein [Chloroflexota bacterium]